MHSWYNDAVKPRYSIHFHVLSLMFSFRSFSGCFVEYVSCACSGCHGMSHFVDEWIDACMIVGLTPSNPSISFMFLFCLCFSSFYPFNWYFDVYVSCACSDCRDLALFPARVAACLIVVMAPINRPTSIIFLFCLCFFRFAHSIGVLFVGRFCMLSLQADVSLCCYINR